MKNNNFIPVISPDILLPKKNTDLSKWAVVACDQFTSNNEYWQNLSLHISDNLSTLNITFPEIYLSADNSERIKAINKTMNDYISAEIFEEYKDSIFLINRTTPYNPTRLGIILAVDLEQYSYIPEDKALIRATEGTILERIPPRVEIRKNVPLELPHIMLLIDDEERLVIEPLFNDNNELIYDFDLNMNGGHIAGYNLKNKQKLIDSLAALISPERIKNKYNGDKILFAVGDGNHSLATAKTCWEQIKKDLPENERNNHPARYALTEIVNIYDEGIKFEPIHRAVFNIDTDNFIKKLNQKFDAYDGVGTIKAAGKDYIIKLPANAIDAVREVQLFCEEYLKENKNAVVDYIHGDEEVTRIGAEKNALVVILPKMSKQELFPYIVQKGVLPRKTFSMGEGNEKRYYIEARKIKR